MSKRSTTGQPKPDQPRKESESSKARQQPKLLREYRSRHERETEIQRIVIIGTTVAVLLMVVILVGAIINEQLIVPNQAVANVNGTNITVSQFKTRARIERALLIQQLNSALSLYQSFGYTSDQLNQLVSSQQPYSTWYGELQVADQLGNDVLNTMVEDELARQKAAELNISVTDADVEAQIQKQVGYTPPSAATPTITPSPTITPTPLVSPTPSPMPTSTPTPNATEAATAASAAATAAVTEAFTPTFTPYPSATPSPTPNVTEQATQYVQNKNSLLNSLATSAGVSQADVMDYFRTVALRAKVEKAVITDVSHTAPYVDARHILVGDQDTANNVLAALKAGESFSALAKAVSTDGSSSQGGELGWAPASNYVKEFADAVKSADIGALVGPVKSQYGYHVIQVRAREDRPLSDSDYQTALDNEFNTYLTNLRTDPKTNVQIFDTWTDNVPTDPQYVPNF